MNRSFAPASPRPSQRDETPRPATGLLAPVLGEWPAVEAVGALIVVDGCKHLLQFRDLRPGIWYPGHWGMFGGQSLAGELPETALRRELAEELGLCPRELRYFADMTFNFGDGNGRMFRTVFEVDIASNEFETLKLSEGSAMRAFTDDEAARLAPVVPCDRFILDLYIARNKNSRGD